jgi:diguanylate cyclase (GGDEF)-like protein
MAMNISFEDAGEAEVIDKYVLIVDDDPLIVKLLHDLLSTTYKCLAATSAPEALQAFEKNEICVVLSDVNMPGMTGIELLSHIHDASPETVCIMVSGEQTMEAPIDALKLGAFDYIQKPFSLSVISAAVSRATDKYRENAEKQFHEQQIRLVVDDQQEELELLKYRDPETGLANHNYLLNEISKTISSATSDDRGVALAHVALNRFRSVTESLGPKAAAGVLRDVTKRWTDVLPDGATLARLESDEFALLLPRLRCSTDALEIVRSLSQCLREGICVDGQELYLSINGGISVFPNDCSGGEDLRKYAKIALRRSVQEGIGTIRFYEPDMNRSAERRLRLETELKKALDAGDLVNYYQPKIDFVSGRIVGMEALVRWDNSKFRSTSASEIVAVAEEVGIIDSLGLRTLTSACRDTARLAKMGIDLKVSVNLSGKQLADNWLPQVIESVISTSGLRPDQLELEITETSLIENPDLAIAVLDSIRSLGVSIAIDDFGTGFSSLSYLKKFPLDTLKIDRLFISDLAENAADREFVNAIVSLAKKLNLQTVMEGIETSEQLDLLMSSGCDEWQGYLCSTPVPFDEFCEIVRRDQDLKTETAGGGDRNRTDE